MHLKHKMALALVAAFSSLGASPALHATRHVAEPARHAPAHESLQDDGTGSGSTCDPFADWNWQFPGSGEGASDSGELRAPDSRWGLTRLPSESAAAQVIGTTPEAIARNFTSVITRNLGNSGTASRISRLSDHELEAIADFVGRGSAAERAGLLKLLATRLDARALGRVARAFGRAPVQAAVAAYASPETRRQFSRMSVLDSGEGGGGGPYPSPSPPRPTIDMTLREICLEYRTAPIGSLSPQASLAETSMFSARYLGPAASTGLAIGTGIHLLIEEFAPSIDDAIGGTIGAMIENFWQASGQVAQGHFEAAFDSLFGFPLTWSSDPYGDWDVSAPMMFYYQSTSTCGW